MTTNKTFHVKLTESTSRAIIDHNRFSCKIGNNLNKQHSIHMKSGTSLSVQEPHNMCTRNVIQNKARH